MRSPLRGSLPGQIEDALRQSEFLIVVCFPGTPHSTWVRCEIEAFQKWHRHEKILVLLTEGEPQESFPWTASRYYAQMQSSGGCPPPMMSAETRSRNPIPVPLARRLRAKVWALPVKTTAIEETKLKRLTSTLKGPDAPAGHWSGARCGTV